MPPIATSVSPARNRGPAHPAWIQHLRVAGPLQHRGIVLRLAALVAVVGLAGCFYTDPINQRPAAELTRVAPADQPGRGDFVTIQAEPLDPDGDDVTITWLARACAAGASRCDASGLSTAVTGPDVEAKFEFQVPAQWFDAASGMTLPVEAVHVTAHVEDAYGAPALQDAELVVDIGNGRPTIDFQVLAVGPPGGPTRITASVRDADDPSTALVVAPWVVYPPRESTSYDFTRVFQGIGASGAYEETYELVADVEGTWTVEVTATDPVGAASTDTFPVLVGPDRPPCIAHNWPEVPPAGELPLDELRRFSVLVVDDDLDVFPPPPPGDPFRGEATFRWWLASPATGGQLAAISDAGNWVELDPAAYDPGDALQLRVEIADRIPRTLPCPADAPTCSIEGNSCIQRLTWTVEVR